jgi:hypothetical protein
VAGWQRPLPSRQPSQQRSHRRTCSWHRKTRAT